MSMNENFNFQTTPHLRLAVSAATDGTTNAQDIAVGATWQTQNTGVAGANAFVEPEQQHNNGQSHVKLDAMSRFIFWLVRSGSGGPLWSYDLNFQRSGVDGSLAPNVISGFMAGQTLVNARAVDNPFEGDFGKTQGAVSLADTLGLKLVVTPGSLVVETITFVGLLVPGFLAAEANKGAAFSANQYRVNS